MLASKTHTFIKVLTTVSFLIMISVNALANILPINGVNTGQVSDYYESLFTPAGFTFGIWGLIYLLLAGYTLFQLGLFQTPKNASGELLNKVGLYFSISSVANTAWIISWHYHLIALTMLLMIIILGCLIEIVQEINKEELLFWEKIFIRLPFSVYFGWITVATIANATVLLVSLGWNGFGIPEPAWTVIIIAVGLVISMTTILRNRDIAYGLVIIWAYIGILIKHTSASGYASQYIGVITTVIVSIVLLLFAEAYLLISQRGSLK